MGSDHSSEDGKESVRINHSRFRKAEILKDNDILRTFVPIEN